MIRLSRARAGRPAAMAAAWCIGTALGALINPQLRAQEAERLGTISFPNSGNAAAQGPFLTGMKLYYSFEYDRAVAAFRAAQKADPGFALAYWGEALTHTHQVWNEQNLAAAREILGRLAPTPAARRAKAGTERERMYMDAGEALYGDGSKPRRDTLFLAALERISEAYPDDDEARVLQALAQLGLNQAVREFTTYMKAGALAEEVLRRNNDHPAAAHFVIHAFDDPVHAPLGLWAARLYSKIAPAAPHAQHMTSHIFVAMGMWDDVVSQNVIASGHDHGAYRAGHYTWWLGYAYGQQGRYAEARKHLETTRKNFATPNRRGEAGALVNLRAHYVIDSERWGDEAARWALPGGLATTDSFVVAYAALKRGERSTAERIAAFLAAAGQASALTADAGTTVRILATELRAALASAAGRHDEAAALAREAAAAEDALPFEFGPPQFVKPTTEHLGEVLLAGGRAGEAQAAFQRSLARTPGRSRSLVGLVRAAAAAGDIATAESAFARLKSNWKHVGGEVPELGELTRLVASAGK